MNAPWQKVKFREILRPNLRPYTLGADEDANLVGMRWYGSGPFHRELKPALRIAKKSHFVIRAGDVIYNKLFAWKGAFGIVPEELDGMFVSDKFPTYELDRNRCDENFLRWYFRCPPLWEEAQTLSIGSAAVSKFTLNPPKFLELTIALPPLAEQRRLVARIEELAAKIEEARNLRRQAADEAEALISSAVSDLSHPRDAIKLDVADILGGLELKNGRSAKSIGDASEIQCLTLSAIRSGRINVAESKSVPMTRDEAAQFLVRTGDVFVVRGNGSKDLCGRAGLVIEKRDSLIFPDLFIHVPLDLNMILPEFFVAAWNSAAIRRVIEEKAKTTSGIWKINQGHILSTRIPVPPITEQRRILVELDALRAKTDTLKRFQVETTTELDALLPSILDDGYRGKL